jgi:hypothetical protein
VEEALENAQKAGGSSQFVARRFDVPDQTDYGIDQFPILPEAECIAVRVDQVREGAQPVPLGLVMGVLELPRIGSLARRFQFHEAHEGVVNGNGVVGTRFQIADERFAYGGYR